MQDLPSLGDGEQELDQETMALSGNHGAVIVSLRNKLRFLYVV